MEAMRCLKRRISDALYRQLVADADRAALATAREEGSNSLTQRERVKPYITGERFLERCAPALSLSEALVTGVHIYTFNQVAETEAWGRAYVARLAPVA